MPLEELYEACKNAREILTGKHAVGRVIARPFIGEPGNYVRTPNRHDFSLAAEAAELSLARARAGHERSRRRQDQRHLRRARHRRVASDEVEHGGHRSRPSGSCASSTTGSSSSNLVETDMLWGHRNDPVNFHRCLQDFDRRLPDLLDALRPGDLLHPHLRSRLRPDDAVDGPLPRARAAARVRRGANADGADPRGRVRRRRCDGERMARGQGAAAGHPGQPIVTP